MSKDHETQAPASGTESTLAPERDRDGDASSEGLREPDGDASSKGFRDPLGKDAVDHLRRYQVMTIPPSARRALMGAELPGAAPELLHDTLPPNRGVKHADDEPTLELEAAVVPAERKRRLRGVVAIVAAVMVALVVVAWLRPSANPVSDPSVTTSAAAPPPSPAATEPLPSGDQLANAPRLRAAPPAPSAPMPAATEATSAVDSTKKSDAEKKPATDIARAPTKKSSTVSSNPPPSPPTAEPAAVTAPPAAGSAGSGNGKGFRLGSR